MTVLQTILNIIIFLLCLSFVVCLHEAGHLAVAKICNVYCFEYSIGFGPVLFKHRFKHKSKKSKLTENLFEANEKPEKVLGETQLSIRALPLGGYVAMAGEDGNIDENGVAIPKERCINGVNHFKQICIMLAGICMNFILALVLFFASSIVPQTVNVVASNEIVVTGESYPSYKAGLQTGDQIIGLYQVYNNLGVKDDESATANNVIFPAKKDQVELVAYQKAKEGVTTVSTYEDLTNSSISYASQDIFSNYLYNKSAKNTPIFDLSDYEEKFGEGVTYSKYYPKANSTRTFTITYIRNGETKTITTDAIGTSATTSDKTTTYSFNYLGISCKTSKYQASFKEAVISGGKTFGQLFVGLYQALGSLFTPSGWQNVGGIISVYKMSAEGTTSGSLSYFLLLWGYISLNLGCFNLLPFPGLDGWQTLLALIESIIRKKIPAKVKNVANSVGLIIMLLLAGLLIVKDIITL